MKCAAMASAFSVLRFSEPHPLRRASQSVGRRFESSRGHWKSPANAGFFSAWRILTSALRNRKRPHALNAPEWTRTTTRETPDKALNLVQNV
jgi:hypothetical protein